MSHSNLRAATEFSRDPGFLPRARQEFPAAQRNERRGDFTSLASGRQFWPLDPRPEEIDIEDIARALSMQCRWGGHVRDFYSVAQHSISVAQHCDRHPVAGLLHDAAEAYLVDVPTPIKKHLHGYAEIEKTLLAAIGVRFDVVLTPMYPEVVDADARALATEQRDLRPRYGFWSPPAEAWAERLRPMNHWTAEREFLALARDLGVR